MRVTITGGQPQGRRRRARAHRTRSDSRGGDHGVRFLSCMLGRRTRSSRSRASACVAVCSDALVGAAAPPAPAEPADRATLARTARIGRLLPRINIEATEIGSRGRRHNTPGKARPLPPVPPALRQRRGGVATGGRRAGSQSVGSVLASPARAPAAAPAVRTRRPSRTRRHAGELMSPPPMRPRQQVPTLGGDQVRRQGVTRRRSAARHSAGGKGGSSVKASTNRPRDARASGAAGQIEGSAGTQARLRRAPAASIPACSPPS